MADDPSKRGPADRSRINVNQEHELRWWCERLRVTPERLRATVRKAGPMVEAVRKELGK